MKHVKRMLSILLLMACLLAFCSCGGPEGTYESAQKFEAQTGYMRMISAGYRHTVGLEADGTVVAVGDNDDGQCDVKSWTDIVAVATGTFHTVGLKADGTVVAVGYNNDGRCDVEAWTDIVAVAAGIAHTIGLKVDGTVVAVGDNGNGQCNVSDWKLW